MDKKEKLGQQPAFPVNWITPNGEINGISKRFYAACFAMQGLLSANPDFTHGSVDVPVPSTLCSLAFKYADELLMQE